MLKIILGTLLIVSSGLIAQNHAGCDDKVHLSMGYCGENCRATPTEEGRRGSIGDCGYVEEEPIDEATIKEAYNSCRNVTYRNQERKSTNSAVKGSQAKYQKREKVIHECGSQEDFCNPKSPCYLYYENGNYDVINPDDKPIYYDEADIKEKMFKGRGPGK